MAMTEAQEQFYIGGANRAAIRAAHMALRDVLPDSGKPEFTPTQWEAWRMALSLVTELACGYDDKSVRSALDRSYAPPLTPHGSTG